MAENFKIYLYPETPETAGKKLKRIELPDSAEVLIEKTEIGVCLNVNSFDEKKTALLKSEICKVFADSFYSFTTPRLEEVVIKKLIMNQETAAAAESCTGGLIAKKLTDVSGASSVFKGGVTAYANEMKVGILGVPAEMIETNGAVSKSVAISLAENVKRIMDTTYGIGITGIAGPGGGSEEKPVGLVYICVSCPVGYWVEALYLGKDKGRDEIREEASNIALYMFNHAVDESPVFQKSMVPYENAAAGEAQDNTFLAFEKKEKLTEDMFLDFKDTEPIETGVIIPPPVELTEDMLLDFEEEDEKAEPRKEENEEENKKLPLYKRVFEYLFPLKADPLREKIRKIAFLVAIVVFIGSLSYIGVYFAGRISDDLQIEKLQQLIDAPVTQEDLDALPEGYLKKFANLYKINPDIAGWIKLGDELDMPVVQSDDNDFYLRKDFYGKHNMRGVPYIDFRSSLNPLSTNTVIYGHNVTPDRIFAVLTNYSKLSFYKENPVIQFDTVYEEGLWKVIAAFTVDVNSTRNEVFDYHNFINAYTNEDFNLFINRIKVRSFINTTVDVNENDHLLTLSTCAFDFEDQRFVVVARKVRPGESAEVNVAEAYSNPNVLMPDIWYQKFGGVKPDVDEFGSRNEEASNNSSDNSSEITPDVSEDTSTDVSQETSSNTSQETSTPPPEEPDSSQETSTPPPEEPDSSENSSESSSPNESQGEPPEDSSDESSGESGGNDSSTGESNT